MKNKLIEVIEWFCPVDKIIFACNKAIDCPSCGQKQVVTTRKGYVLKELENNNYYKLYR